MSVSGGIENHASFAPLAVGQLADAADAYATLLACEAVAAVRALRLQGVRAPGHGWGAVLAACEALPDDVRDRDLSADLDLARGLLPALARRWRCGDPTVGR